MPLYEYRCESCGHQFEVIQKFSDAPIEVCRNCGSGPVVKLLSSPAIQFKGSGWYITDYARKDSGSKDSGKDSGKPASSDATKAAPTSTTSSSDSTSTTSTAKSGSKPT